MKLKRILPIIILLSVNNIYLSQEVSKVGTSAAPFLQIGVGSRASALGEAYTAISDGASAMYWNPSGIDSYSENEVTFNYSDWFAEMNYFYAGGVLHLGEIGSFGFSVTSFATPEMIVRTVEEPEGIGTRFDAADIALGVSYAKRITDRFSFGATFKYINRRIWHMNASAIAMDFGILYKLPWENLQLGMSILNFGSKLKMEGVDAIVFTDIDESITGNNTQIMSNLYSKEWALPLTLRVGLAYKVFKSDYHQLLVSSDYIHPSDNFESANIGGEYGFMGHFFIRAGYKSLFLKNRIEGLTFGGGIKYGFAELDYSYVKLSYFDYVQQFSLNLKL